MGNERLPKNLKLERVDLSAVLTFPVRPLKQRERLYQISRAGG